MRSNRYTPKSASETKSAKSRQAMDKAPRRPAERKPAPGREVAPAVEPAPLQHQGVQQLTIDTGHDGQRIDNFLCGVLKGVPKTHVYKMLRSGEVRVNKGRIKADYRLQEGDVVRVPPVRRPEQQVQKPSQGLVNHLRQCLLYEDEGILAFNKPAGLAVHGGSGVALGLIEAVRAGWPNERFLELVHRLDRDTSGVILLARSRRALLNLHKQLRDGEMHKQYLALLTGKIKGAQHRVDAPLLKNELASGERIVRVSREGKPALTEFSVSERFDALATLVEARPHTGRTHQIRVHAQHLGHAIVGDGKYGRDEDNQALAALGLRRLFLHATALTFKDPATGRELTLRAELPEDYEAGLASLRRAISSAKREGTEGAGRAQ